MTAVINSSPRKTPAIDLLRNAGPMVSTISESAYCQPGKSPLFLPGGALAPQPPCSQLMFQIRFPDEFVTRPMFEPMCRKPVMPLKVCACTRAAGSVQKLRVANARIASNALR